LGLALPLHAIANPPAGGPSPASSSPLSCGQICAAFEASVEQPSAELVAQHCSLDSSQLNGYSQGAINNAFEECTNPETGGLFSKWPSIAPNCGAYDLATRSPAPQWISALANSTVAAVCGVACLYPAWTTACTWAGLANTAQEILNVVIVKEIYKDSVARQTMAETGLDPLNDIVMPAAAPVLNIALNGLPTGGGGDAAAAPAETGSSGGNNTLGRLATCMTGIMAGIKAGMKFDSIGKMGETAESACRSVSEVYSTVPTFRQYLQTAMGRYSKPQTLNASIGNPSSTARFKGPSGSLADSQAFNEFVNSPEQFGAVMQEAAQSDEGLREFLKKTDIGALYGAVRQNPGLLQAAIRASEAQQAASSAVPASLNSDTADPGLRQALRNSEDELRRRAAELARKLAGTAYVGGGAKGGKTSGKANAGGFAFPFGGPGMGAKELKFTGPAGGAAAGQAGSEAEVEGDIFHSNFSGTLFDIVSMRLGRSKAKVDEYEWELPLNRARQNLPWKASGEGPRKVVPAVK
jgi:hypothetical protein